MIETEKRDVVRSLKCWKPIFDLSYQLNLIRTIATQTINDQQPAADASDPLKRQKRLAVP